MENKRFCDFATAEVKHFEFTWYEQGQLITKRFSSDLMIPEDAYEWEYALLEVIDEVLSLKVGETMWLCAIRGDKQSKGVLCRTK